MVGSAPFMLPVIEHLLSVGEVPTRLRYPNPFDVQIDFGRGADLAQLDHDDECVAPYET